MLERAGWQLFRSSKHLIFKKEGREEMVTVPNHPSKDLKPGTLRSILKAAQISEEDFMNLR